MASYSLLIKPSAVKELEALPLKDRRKIVGRIQGLASEPRPHGSEKLSSLEQYRVRQGDYRVVYSVDDDTRTVLVVKVGHRRDVYR
ncbi:MAG TPA: type II toxin-antitoxin system RelE/ParE family toxin [Gemmatimonadales bacterium]|nr:type II toxin-antitoxin system RelE/ParE family toxin [Gemmatimonadales bacterium]